MTQEQYLTAIEDARAAVIRTELEMVRAYTRRNNGKASVAAACDGYVTAAKTFADAVRAYYAT
jgi:hypothetical protein